MKDFLLDILVCPFCKDRLSVSKTKCISGDIETGELICSCGKKYPIINGIPRFTNSDGYVSNFSFEWNRFCRTQLDSFNHTSISANRFKQVVGLDFEQLKGKRILEIGCGMGRFLEIAARANAEVVGIDLSFSVDAARSNLKHLPNVHLIQADIFNLPLTQNKFDLIYSIGVIHHTPNPKEAFLRIASLLCKNGSIMIWVSPKSKLPFLPRATNIIRLFTSRMQPLTLLNLIQKFIPFALVFIRTPFIGRFLKGWIIPVCDYKGELPLNKKQLLEWSILDTLDLLSPKYLYPCSAVEVKNWFIKAALGNIIITSPAIIARGRRGLLQERFIDV